MELCVRVKSHPVHTTGCNMFGDKFIASRGGVAFFLFLDNQFYGEKLFSFLERRKIQKTLRQIFTVRVLRASIQRNEKVFFFLVFYKNCLTRSSKCLRCDSLRDKYRSVYQRYIIFIYAFCCVFSSVRRRKNARVTSYTHYRTLRKKPRVHRN